MAGLLTSEDATDTIAHRAALEAVTGILARGGSLDQESVHNWLGAVFGANTSLIARALHYAVRIIEGPKPND